MFTNLFMTKPKITKTAEAIALAAAAKERWSHSTTFCFHGVHAVSVTVEVNGEIVFESHSGGCLDAYKAYIKATKLLDTEAVK